MRKERAHLLWAETVAAVYGVPGVERGLDSFGYVFYIAGFVEH